MPDFIRPAPDEKNPDSAQREQNQKLSRVMNDLLRRGDIFRDEVGKFKIRDSRLDGAGLGTFLELDDSWFTNDSEDTTISDYNVRFDDLGGYSGEPGADALVATLAGWYYLSCQARFEGMDGLISISLVLNGTTVLVKDSLKTGAIDAFLNTGTAYYLAVGDAITLVIRQETGTFQQPDLFRLNFVFLGADALGARVTLTAAQTLTNNTQTTLTGYTVQRDDLAAYSAGQPTRLTAPADGWYLISVRTVLATTVATLFLTGLRRSATLFMGEASTESRSANCDNWYQTAYYLTAGQYVEVRATQVSGGSRNVTEAQFGMVQLKGDAGVAGVGTPRGANLTLTSNVSLAGLGDTLIDTYTTVNHDDLIGYDLGTPERITIPRSGWHVITATIRFQSPGSCRVTLSTVLNGATTLAQYTAGTVTQLNNPITVSYYLYAGDYLELYAGQDSGSPFNATSAFFTVNYIGASSSLSTDTNESSLALKVIQSLLDGGFIIQTGVGVWEFANNGDVVGPASASDSAIARFDGTTGKLIQSSAWLIRDDGAMELQFGLAFTNSGGVSGGLLGLYDLVAASYAYISLDNSRWDFSGGDFIGIGNVNIGGIYTGIGSGLTALNATNVSSGTLALARGGTGSNLSATGPGLHYQATAGSVTTVVQSITGAYTVIAGATSSIPLTLKSHASGAAADLFQIVRGSDSAVGVRAPSEFSWQVRTNFIIGGSSSTSDDGNLRLWFYNGATQKILWGSIGGTISILVTSDIPFLWDSGTSISATPNLGLLPDSAGVLRVTNGSTGRGGILVATAAVWAGGSTTNARVGGSLFTHFADQGNGTTVETDLFSDTTPASTLGTNGDRLEAEYGGLFVSSATATRQIKLYFAGTAIFDSGALTLSLSSAWTMYVTITRVSATVVRYMISMTTEGAALAAYTSVGELTGLTLSSTNILKITGQASGVGAASSDIVAKLGSVNWASAP